MYTVVVVHSTPSEAITISWHAHPMGDGIRHLALAPKIPCMENLKLPHPDFISLWGNICSREALGGRLIVRR